MHPLTSNLRLVPASAALDGFKYGISLWSDLAPEVNEGDRHGLSLRFGRSPALAAIGSENRPIDIGTKLLAPDAGQAFDVGAVVGGNPVFRPLIDHGMPRKPKVAGHLSHAASDADRSVKGCFGFIHAPILASFSSFARKTVQQHRYPAQMTYSKRIKAHRLSLGLSEAQYAQMIGVSRGTIQQWERGDTAPNRNRQPAVAQFMGISVAQLMSENDGTEPGPATVGRVPLLSDVQAGDFVEYVDNFHPGDGGLELIPTSVPVKQHTFALRVVGDSMEPEFREGMILIIEPEMDPLPGDFVVAKDGDEATTFKQLVKDGGDWYLKPLNPRYPLKPLGTSRVIGVLRAVEKRYR